MNAGPTEKGEQSDAEKHKHNSYGYSYSIGKNLKDIAADLTERNIIFFENRSTWSKAVVMRILENKRYIGNDGYPAIIDVGLFEKINRAKNEKSHKKGEQPEIISYLKTVMFIYFNAGFSFSQKVLRYFLGALKCLCILFGY